MDAPAIQKVDRRKQLSEFYTAEATPKVVDVPPLDSLMIDGHGDPDSSPDFAAATTRAMQVWETPITDYASYSGHRLPRSGSAVWRSPQGDLTYIELDVTSVSSEDWWLSKKEHRSY